MNDDIKLLKQYLNRYRAAKNRKDNLVRRVEEIRAEFEPIKAVGFRQTPRSKTNIITDSAAALTIKIDEIEERIEAERYIMQQRLTETMDIIDLLPKDSIERDIIELKYIDGIVWPKVKDHGVWLERTAYFSHLDKALKELMQYEKVKDVISKYKNDSLVF